VKARKSFKLYNDIVIPSLGFGTFRLGVSDDEVTVRVKLALFCGYRHIDSYQGGSIGKNVPV
jgi:diketogulonate reductase-like aldo/keto reductase